LKKIAFIIDNLKGGGAEKAIKILVEELYERKIDPIVILLENKLDYSLNDGIEVHSLSEQISKYSFLILHFKLLKLLKKLSPDILYATNTKAQILSLLTKPFLDTKRIINIQVDLTKQYERRGYIFNLYSRLLNYTDSYSFISKGIHENLKDKIPKKENIFLPNAIDFKEIDDLKSKDMEGKYEYIFEKKVFITIGRLTEQKGQWILLEAFSRVQYEANLVILGSGEKETELKNLAKKLGIESRVFFLGFQENPFKFLYHSDVFVLSSLWEGFGNVIVEAMRCELPVISTDCPSGPREILSSNSDISKKLKGENEFCDFGMLSPVNDSFCLSQVMEEIMKNNRLLNKYKQQPTLRAKAYDSKFIVDKFIKNILIRVRSINCVTI